MLALLLAAVLPAPPAWAEAPKVCEYTTYAWSVTERRAVDRKRVTKPYSEVGDDERDPRLPQCTVCEVDQELIEIDGLKPFRVCRHFAPQVRAALTAVKASGQFDLVTVTGYRPGRTRGKVVDGKRTQLSNHSFGAAIDINAANNGLYGKCKLPSPPKAAADVAGCSKRMGGAWAPKRSPRRTIVRGGVVHREFTKFWRWGGDLQGALKDFMHFSPDGT